VALFNVMNKVECFSDFNASNIIDKGEYALDAKKLKGPIYDLKIHFKNKEDDQIQLTPRIGKKNIIHFDKIYHPIVGISGFSINVRSTYLKYADFVAVTEKEIKTR